MFILPGPSCIWGNSGLWVLCSPWQRLAVQRVVAVVAARLGQTGTEWETNSSTPAIALCRSESSPPEWDRTSDTEPAQRDHHSQWDAGGPPSLGGKCYSGSVSWWEIRKIKCHTETLQYRIIINPHNPSYSQRHTTPYHNRPHTTPRIFTESQ